MGKCFLHGNGGGVSLNFKVVQYDPGAELPESAAVNTIAVFTNVDIAAWHFSSTQPENMKQGDVWFATGTSSTVAFNALKKSDIEVYPLSAKQYVDGEWVSVSAMTYQDDTWAEWVKYLLTADGFVPDLGAMAAYGEYGKSMSISPLSTGGVLIERTGSGTAYVVACSEESFDVTDYNTMRIKTGAVVSSYISVGISTVNNSLVAATSGFVAGAKLTADSEVVVDLSSCSGEYYLAIAMDYYSASMSAELLEITLEE